MAQIVQIASCIIDIVLILTVIHFIVDDSFRIKKPVLAIAIFVCGFCGLTFLLSRYIGLSYAMLVIRVVLPFIIYAIFGKSQILKQCGKYVLSLLFFSTAEILSIFIDMLVVAEIFGFASTTSRFLIISSIVNLLAIIFIYFFCGIKNTKISFVGTEWALLLLANCIAFLLLAAVGYSKQIPFMDMIPQEFLQVMIKYSVIFLYLFFVISLVNGKIANHFKAVGQITQENMEQQLEYFKAYKNSQEEISRYKHDMKNHFLYLSALSEDNKVAEMKEYINSLSDHWESIPMPLSTGNTVVDAIVYGKSFLFEQNNITLAIEGQFVSELDMEPIDICTIFTNAIDNAVEANLKCEDNGSRYLKIVIKNNNSHYFIIFENQTSSPVKIINNHIESDKKEDNHGFGLKNIEQAILKYNGTLNLKSDEDNVFVLEAVIPK